MMTESTDKPIKNYAYIDSQNLNMTIQNLGWNVDWAKFREYLAQKHSVAVAYLFIGYIAENQELYSFLQKAGFVIIFKPVVIGKEGNVKGNIDAELVLQVMIDQQQYDKAVVVTGDGDFHGLINYLYAQGKLQALLVPNLRQYSQLLKTAARERIDFISNMRRELEYKKRPRNASPANAGSSSNQSSSGRSPRRGMQASLEDSLIKAVDAGHTSTGSPLQSSVSTTVQTKEPITSEEPGDKVSTKPEDKPAEMKPVQKPAPEMKPIEPKS